MLDSKYWIICISYHLIALNAHDHPLHKIMINYLNYITKEYIKSQGPHKSALIKVWLISIWFNQLQNVSNPYIVIGGDWNADISRNDGRTKSFRQFISQENYLIL